MIVREVMTPRPITVVATADAKTALALMAVHHVTMLPVVDAHGTLRGVVSEPDLLRDRIEPDQRLHERPLGDTPRSDTVHVVDVMTTSVHSVAPDNDVAEAVELFVTTGVKSMPVIARDGELEGVLSRSDVVRAVARSDEALEAAIDDLFARGGLAAWSARVRDGVAEISGTGPRRQASLAKALARTVAGVTGARVTDQQSLTSAPSGSAERNPG
jgi:CBS domain-containing protein